MSKQTDVKSGEFRVSAQDAAEKVELHEITTAQRELWLSASMSDGLPFNMWGYGTIEGPLQVALLRQAIDAIIEETPAMQARFIEQDGELYQYRAGRVRDPLTLHDFSHHAQPEQAAQCWMRQDADRVISALEHDLFAFAVLTLAPGHYILYRRFHHMLADGRSAEEFMRRIALYYNALAEKRLSLSSAIAASPGCMRTTCSTAILPASLPTSNSGKPTRSPPLTASLVRKNGSLIRPCKSAVIH